MAPATATCAVLNVPAQPAQTDDGRHVERVEGYWAMSTAVRVVLVAGLGLAVLAVASFAACLVLPMFGIGGNQVEHAYVSFDVHPDGRHIVFSSAGADLFVLDLATRQVTRLTQTTAMETSPCYSPDGQTVVYATALPPGESGEGSALFSIPASGGEAHRLTQDPGVSDGAARFSPDGKRLVFSRAYRHRPYSMGGMTWDNADVCVLDLATGTTTRLTHEAYYGGGTCAFVEGGRSVVYSAMGHGESLDARLYKVDASGRDKPVPFLPRPSGTGRIGAWASDVCFTRDGRSIAFVSDRARPFAYDLWVGDSTGAGLRPLAFTKVSSYNQSPVFAPDGKSLYILAGTESNGHGRAIFSLYNVDLSGKAVRVADSGLFTDPVSWKPR